MKDKRHYGQFCGLAIGLDVIGERWTLLIIRELLISPARFNELLDNLPGIGPNLLSARLKELTKEGLIERSAVPGDGRGSQYRLTALGEGLREPLLGLARWGMGLVTEERATGISRAAWGFLAVQAMIAGRKVPEVDEEYEFRVGGETFHIAVRGGAAVASRGPAEAPVLTVTTDADTFIRIGAELLTPFEAAVTGRLRIDGDTGALQRCARLIGLATEQTRVARAPALDRASGAPAQGRASAPSEAPAVGD